VQRRDCTKRGYAMRFWGAVIFAASLALPAWGQQPTAVKDCPTCPELLRVSPGSFVMGAPAGEEEREFRSRSAVRPFRNTG